MHTQFNLHFSQDTERHMVTRHNRHSIAQNDLGMINLSGLEEHLADVLQKHSIGEAQLLQVVYGDAIYIPSEVILVRGGDSLYFRRMNQAREK